MNCFINQKIKKLPVLQLLKWFEYLRKGMWCLPWAAKDDEYKSNHNVI